MSAVARLLVSLVVWALFLAACMAPAVKVDEGGHACTAIRLGTLPGFVTLLLGCVPPLTVPWSANLLLVVGWVLLLCNKTKAALDLGVAAALLGLTTWLFSFEWKELLVGYYLWQSSLLSFALGTLAIRIWQPTRTTTRRSEADERDSECVQTVPRAESAAIADEQGREKSPETFFGSEKY